MTTSSNSTHILDLHTQKNYDDVGGKKGISNMGFSFATLINHNTNEIFTYNESEIEDLINNLNSSGLIVGINLRKFSYKILSSYNNINFNELKTLDILDYLRKKIIFKPSVEDLFFGTLSVKRTYSNMIVPNLYKQGKLREIKEYSTQLATTISDVYSYGKNKGYVFFSDRNGQRWKISVDW